MLVITDKATLGIGRQSGLTGTRETEEDGGVLTIHIAVGRAVHGSDTLQGQIVVHHREHTLLHLTAIPSVDDYLLTAGNVEGYAGLRVQTQLLIVLHLSLRCIVNNEVRLKVLQLLSSGLNEHVGHEVCLPCHLHDEANSHAGVLVGTAESIHHIEILVAEFLDSQVLHSSPHLLRHGVVVVLVLLRSPPYGVL